MKDTEIIELYLLRQESAIAQTAKKYGAYLHQVAYNILGSREDTEEVLSDTYFAAWNAIPPQYPSVLRHFLSRIARNLAIDRLDYRTAGRRNANMVTLLSELEGCVPDSRADLEKAMEAKEIAASINRFLAGLKREDCVLFVCRYYYSMTVAELMVQHGLSEGVVKYRLSTLRRKLRRHLEQEGITV